MEWLGGLCSVGITFVCDHIMLGCQHVHSHGHVAVDVALPRVHGIVLLRWVANLCVCSVEAE